ncbi:MAG: hypothetical protein IPI10_19130 [Bacteroidetes bacterium]|nr:hypothetical protein [Bacteroidota bacterium]
MDIFPEAASRQIDKQKIYYHQKDSSLAYRIFRTRYRTGTTQVNDQVSKETLKVYPNPANIVHIILLSTA